MKIHEKIRAWMIRELEERQRALEEMGAPDVIIEGNRKALDDLKAGGKLKIGGDLDALEEEQETVEAKKGRGGKVYYQINGNVMFFPKAAYGMYIKRVQK